MNYLAGPLTRNQIPALNELVGAKQPAPTAEPAPGKATTTTAAKATISKSAGSTTRPAVPTGAAGNKVDIDIPKARFHSPTIADRGGVMTTPFTYEACRSAIGGNDEFSITLT